MRYQAALRPDLNPVDASFDEKAADLWRTGAEGKALAASCYSARSRRAVLCDLRVLCARFNWLAQRAQRARRKTEEAGLPAVAWRLRFRGNDGRGSPKMPNARIVSDPGTRVTLPSAPLKAASRRLGQLPFKRPCGATALPEPRPFSTACASNEPRLCQLSERVMPVYPTFM